MQIGSLFSGVGGMDLGLEWAGLGETVWQVEADVGCRAVLAQWWPEADRSVTDVRSASAESLRLVDLICGGFPCVDVSSAGSRVGLAGERSGLWYEQLRVINELRPRWCVVENVSSGKALWLPHVRHGLFDAGYRTAAVEVSAADVGAPHLRRRIFVVAYAIGERRNNGVALGPAQTRRTHTRGRCDVGYANDQGELQPEGAEPDVGRWSGNAGSLGHAAGARRKGPSGIAVSRSESGARSALSVRDEGDTESFDDGQRVGGGAVGRLGRGTGGPAAFVDRWPAGRGQPQEEWEPPRTVTPRRGDNRTRRLRALGNICVPQCAAVVGRMIAAVEDGEPWESVFS